MKWYGCLKVNLVFVVVVATWMISQSPAVADFTFGSPQPVPFVEGNDYYIGCFSSDGLEMYTWSTRPGGQGDRDIWVQRRGSKDENWGPPENLGPVVNSPNEDELSSISADGLTLYFRGPGRRVWVWRYLDDNAPDQE